jgi:hypothetical protein
MAGPCCDRSQSGRTFFSNENLPLYFSPIP